jgi:hypothetical protein
MLTFLVHTRTAWGDYFTASNQNNLSSQTYTSRQILSDTSVHISNCLFRSITSTSDGGALYCSSSVTYLLVESTSFFSCNTSNRYGGAIYFYNTGSGQFVLYEVCGNDCCSTYTGGSSYGQFAYIYVNNGPSSKNCVNYSTTARCVNENPNSYYTIRLENGNICCLSINMSINKCYSRSILYCYPYKDSNSVTCSFSYSSFAENNATGNTCILINTASAKNEIKSCNILRNTQVTLNTDGIICTAGNMVIKDSCILENKATYIFYGSITLSNCTVDSTSNNGYLTTQSTATKSFILALKHMSTRNFNTEYDSVGTLTPITPPSSSKKQKLCYTSGMHFCQCRISDFFSFSIFIFSFINPYSYNDLCY